MAENDLILVDGIIDDRVNRQIPSEDRSEVFEYFAFEQLLKNADLSNDELQSGSMDGRDDGGIDGAFILVNGHLLSDPSTFPWPKAGAELELWILTCKLHDTFRQAPLDLLVASLGELLRLAAADESLKGSYSADAMRLRRLLLFAYKRVAPHLRSFHIRVAYASRGDTSKIGESVQARADQLVTTLEGLFGGATVTFQFVGSSELMRLYRNKKKFSLELPFLECLARGERYVLLTTLTDYAKFAMDEDGTPRRYLFDANVRDYMGLNQVNEDIAETLRRPDSADFWWLNNGVTILASGAAVTGKSIQVQDVQIVNGLQTTESITQWFSNGGTDPNSRAVLVKVVVTTDPGVRDGIIRATNNQSAVETASLRATDPAQRDIEDILERHGLYYERRKNYHKNQGRPQDLIISPLYAASAIVSLVLKSPSEAARLKQRFMRNTASYEAIFDPKLSLEVWPKAVTVLRAMDAFLKCTGTSRKRPGERFLRNWRQVAALLAVARVTGTYAFAPAAISSFDAGQLSNSLLQEIWEVIDRHRHPTSTKPPTKMLIRRIAQDASAQFGIQAHKVVESLHPFEDINRGHIDDDFINQVDAILPKQPWKPGVHREIAERLNCSPKNVSEAITALVLARRRNTQRDGIVFNNDGVVIDFDPTRVTTDEAKQARMPE